MDSTVVVSIVCKLKILNPVAAALLRNSIFLTDVDECMENIDMCHLFATCSNIPGSYNCTCNPGYSGDGFTDCTGMC